VLHVAPLLREGEQVISTHQLASLLRALGSPASSLYHRWCDRSSGPGGYVRPPDRPAFPSRVFPLQRPKRAIYGPCTTLVYAQKRRAVKPKKQKICAGHPFELRANGLAGPPSPLFWEHVGQACCASPPAVWTDRLALLGVNGYRKAPSYTRPSLSTGTMRGRSSIGNC
jgi:hypothetical protein